MPANMYGAGDDCELENSHVLPAFIRKMHEARRRSDDQVTVWGTGMPRRESLFNDDMADACVHLMQLIERGGLGALSAALQAGPPLVSIGCGEDLTIRELAQTVVDVVKSEGCLTFDSSKPDGTPRKLLDVSRMSRLGWSAKTPLREGLCLAYADFPARRASATEMRQALGAAP